MSNVTFHQSPVTVSGSFPKVGDKTPDFMLCAADLSDIQLADFSGKNLILNIFPSIDTPVCATSVRRFNQEATALANTVVLCISADLPFATGRFCEIEGLANVKSASFFRAANFTQDYGVNVCDGPLKGLAARAVIVVNPAGEVIYSERVSEITDEPNYLAALTVLGK